MTSPSAVASFSRLRESSLDFFLWWKDEMQSLMPVKVRQRLNPSRRARRQVIVAKSGFTVDGTTIQPLATLGETLLSLKVAEEFEDAAIRLILDETRYLERTISHRRLPLSALRRAAELDVLTETPFSTDDVKILLAARADRGAVYYIVRRDIVEEIREQLRLAGLKVSGIYLGAEQNEVVSGLCPSDFFDPARRSVAKYLDYLLGIFVLLACLFAVYQINQKMALAAEKLDAEIHEADGGAHAARSKYDQYAKKIKQLQMLKTKQAETLQVVRAWEELSRIFPDTAFLTDLVIKNETLEIAGFSETPAALIGAIETSPLFQRPQFASPVVKIPGFSGDHFLISFDRERG